MVSFIGNETVESRLVLVFRRDTKRFVSLNQELRGKEKYGQGT